MSVDPINPDQTNQTATDPAAAGGDAETAAYAPAVGEVVRLDDPEQDGDPRYGLVVGDQAVVALETVQRYELPLYRAS
jgi:hypothetical protein